MKIIINKQTEKKKLDKKKKYEFGIKISKQHFDFIYMYEDYVCNIIPSVNDTIIAQCNWKNKVAFNITMSPKSNGTVEIELGEIKANEMYSAFNGMITKIISELTNNIVNSFDFIIEELEKTCDVIDVDILNELPMEDMKKVQKYYKKHNLEEIYSYEEREKAWQVVGSCRAYFGFMLDKEVCTLEFSNKGYFFFSYFSDSFCGKQLYSFDGECLFVVCKEEKEDLLMEKATELNEPLSHFMTVAYHLLKTKQITDIKQILDIV